MNWEAAAAIAEVTGAVAVVVSLIYLAVQIRQNTRVVRGSTLDAITAHQQSELRWSSEMPEVFEKAMDDPEALNFAESWKLSEWTTAAFIARQNEYVQYRQGLLEEEVWQASENIIRLLLGIEWFRKWWQDYGRNNMTATFVAKVESLAGLEPRRVKDELAAVLRRQI